MWDEKPSDTARRDSAWPGRGFDPLKPYGAERIEITQPQPLNLTLFTDSHVIHGHVESRLQRLSDILNQAEHDFIVVSDAVMDEFGTRGLATLQAEFAQVNLSTLLFAAMDATVEPRPELRLMKSQEDALIVVPPFKIVGRIHVLPDRSLRDALAELTGRFIPVTDATYWSDALSEPKVQAPFVAFNHSRAQILATHHERDPWQGLRTP